MVQDVVFGHDDRHLLRTPVVNRVQRDVRRHAGHGPEPVEAHQFGLLKCVRIVTRRATRHVRGRVLRHIIGRRVNAIIEIPRLFARIRIDGKPAGDRRKEGGSGCGRRVKRELGRRRRRLAEIGWSCPSLRGSLLAVRD